jgi:two-component system NtrC family response regulator
LENTLEKAILADPLDPVLYPIHLPPEIRLSRIRSRVDSKNTEEEPTAPQEQIGTAVLSFPETLLPFKEYRKQLSLDIERHYLQLLLHESEGDIATACTLSELSRSRLYDLLKTHGLTNSPQSSPE